VNLHFCEPLARLRRQLPNLLRELARFPRKVRGGARELFHLAGHSFRFRRKFADPAFGKFHFTEIEWNKVLQRIQCGDRRQTCW
jgi:hypothetical protein